MKNLNLGILFFATFFFVQYANGQSPKYMPMVCIPCTLDTGCDSQNAFSTTNQIYMCYNKDKGCYMPCDGNGQFVNWNLYDQGCNDQYPDACKGDCEADTNPGWRACLVGKRPQEKKKPVTRPSTK